MKNLIFLMFAMTMLLLSTSCSKDDNGLSVELVAPVDTEVNAGMTVDIILTLNDDTGISQLAIEGQSVGIDVLENYTTDLNATFSWEGEAMIPTDAQVDDKFEILVTLSDIDGNRIESLLELTVVE